MIYRDETKGVEILLNRAPIVPHHFLLLSKRPTTQIDRLSKEDYVQISETAQKIFDFYRAKNPSITARLFSINGPEAGQVGLKRAMFHLVLLPSAGSERWVALRMLFNTIFGTLFSFNDTALAKEVSKMKEEFVGFATFEADTALS